MEEDKSLEKTYEPIPKKKSFMASITKKDVALGLLFAFLILNSYFAGQQSTMMFQTYVKEVCPSLNVTAIDPFGMTYQRQIVGYVGEGNFNFTNINGQELGKK